MGHYSIAAYAVQLVKNPELRKLLENNLDSLSFDIETLRKRSSQDILANVDFVPLADVADEVWKKYKSKPGGRDTVSIGNGQTNGPEHPNHYADIDFPYIDNKSLRELCLAAPNIYFNPPAFLKYYDWLAETHPELAGNKNDVLKQGLLPFRIWQFFNAIEATDASDIASFVAAAGLVAHYWGDACQPLHGSVYADGDPSRKKTITHPQSQKQETISYAAGVHSAYETAMIDRCRGKLFDDIDQHVQDLAQIVSPPLYATGEEAGLATIKLMQATWEDLNPMRICDKFEQLGGTPSPRVTVIDGLFDEFGKSTAKIMARGAQFLACFWDSAWEAWPGGKGMAGNQSLDAVPQIQLRAKYEDVTFVRSLTLSQIGEVLK
jgi:hypothetical protein